MQIYANIYADIYANIMYYMSKYNYIEELRCRETNLNNTVSKLLQKKVCKIKILVSYLSYVLCSVCVLFSAHQEEA